MTDPIIHQLYCTHCTYGTSALHRHTGNIKDQPFEYSTRAGSIEQSESHQRFQQFEKLYFRGLPLPSDTPTERRQNLTAASSPWRRLVAAAIPGGSLLAHVAYRTTDTSKPPRTGSYFAHLLLHNPVEPTERGWSLADALQMWGSEFWLVEDRDDLEHELKTVSDLRQLPGFGGVINDRALLSFLTTPADGEFNDGSASSARDELSLACAIPQRWRQRSVEDRRALFTALLQSVLNLNLDRRERLSLAVEPSLAALLFYGVIRLLPRSGLVDQLSVSTFEPHTESSSLVLTATDFFDPATADLLPVAYRGGVAVNTYGNKPLPTSPTTPYVSTMLGRLLAPNQGPTAVDLLRDELNRLSSSGLTKIRDYEQYLGVDDLAERLVQPNPSNPVTDRDLSGLTLDVARLKFRRLVLTKLQNLSNNDETWAAFRKAPARVTLIAHVLSEEPALAERGAVLEQLCDCLPEKELPRFFEDRQIPAELRLVRLQREVMATGELPAGCDSLWSPVKSGEAAESPLLERLFVALDASRLEIFCQSVVEPAAIKREIASPRVLTMLTYLAKAAKHGSTEKLGILTQRLHDERFEEDHWDVLLRHHELRTQLFELYPADEPFLRERLVGLLDHLPNSGRKFPLRCDILKAAEARLPVDRRQELSGWLRVRSHLQSLNEEQETPTGLFDRLVTGTHKRRLQEIGTSLAVDCQRILRDQYGCRTADSQLRALKPFIRANSVSGEIPKAFLFGMNQALRGDEEPVVRVRDEQEKPSLVSRAIAWLPLAAFAILATISTTTVVIFREPIWQLITASGETEPEKNKSKKAADVAKAEKAESDRKAADEAMAKKKDAIAKAELKANEKKRKADEKIAAALKEEKERAARLAANAGDSPVDALKPVNQPDGEQLVATSPKGNEHPRLSNRRSTWKPDKVYIAKPSGPQFDGTYFDWIITSPVEFLTLHGPQIYSTGDTKRRDTDPKTWPLMIDWIDDRQIDVSTRLPTDTGIREDKEEVVVVWRINVESEHVTCRRAKDEVFQKLQPISKRIEASWRNCVLGIHTRLEGKDVREFHSFDSRPLIPHSPAKADAKQLRFTFCDPNCADPSDGRLWAVGGAGSVNLGERQLSIGDGSANSLYSGKWPLRSWPENRIAPRAAVTFSNGTAMLEVTLERELVGNKKSNTDEFEIKELGQTEPLCEIKSLQSSLQLSLTALSRQVENWKKLKVDKPIATQIKAQQLVECRALCKYFGVPYPDLRPSPSPLDPLNGETIEQRQTKWQVNVDRQIKDTKESLGKKNPEMEKIAVAAIKLGIEKTTISGSIYRVIEGQVKGGSGDSSEKDDANPQDAARVIRGIAVQVAEFKGPDDVGGKKP